jgi:hypothetical protein
MPREAVMRSRSGAQEAWQIEGAKSPSARQAMSDIDDLLAEINAEQREFERMM